MPDEKKLPEIVIDPIKPEGRKKHSRKLSGQTKKTLNELTPLLGMGHRPNKSNEIGHKVRDIDLATTMYKLMLSGKNEREIATQFDCTVQVVRSYLQIQLQQSQDGLMMLRGKSAILGYERLEQYSIAPMIAKITAMIEEGTFDPRPYEILMKTIKLQSELVAPKASVNIQNNGSASFVNSNSALYLTAVNAMREEGYINLDEIVIDAEDVTLSEYRIEKVEELVSRD